ncbi:RNA-binding S4 domain-containing protein [Streptomyces griseoviridis]|uniref:RNA-binding S4 domain-containing protein n=1 Tax=Streptomyces griseoviridis TaxID=45398 RepID=A0A918LKR1_STRGD|nr:RNA-binding S4 domain-containing protein [Streptomyces niveoruber]GGS65827.1 hypothetical protein GCM10010238_63340 [Streptomyces niveoruber]
MASERDEDRTGAAPGPTGPTGGTAAPRTPAGHPAADRSGAEPAASLGTADRPGTPAADAGGSGTPAADAGGSGATAAGPVDPKVAAAIAAAEAAGPQQGGSVRVDSWIWAVRLVKSRSLGATACRGGHVRVNGERVKPSHSLRAGDEVRLRHEGRERVVVVKRLIRKRVGAPAAVQCYVDNSPPPPPRLAVAPVAVRAPGAGRPTKRDRRELERLRALNSLNAATGPKDRPGGR